MTGTAEKPLTYHMDFGDIRQELNMPPATMKNVGEVERLVCMIGGGLLAGVGLGQRTPLGVGVALLGAALAHRGSSGHCAIYEKMGMSSRQ